MKERLILGKGFVRIIELRTKEFYPVRIPMSKFRKLYCYCKTGCACKPWKVVLER